MLPAQLLDEPVVSTKPLSGIPLVIPSTTPVSPPEPPGSPSSIGAQAAVWEMIHQEQVDQVNAYLAARHQSQLAAEAQSRTTAHGSQTSVSTGSGGWAAVAQCEEGGRNDPVHGYFGVMPGNWGNGVSPASDYATQEAYVNSLNGGHAPYVPAGCAAGGYGGW